MIRVAHLLPTLEVGGKERTVIDLCNAATALGQDARIITYDPIVPGRACLDSGKIPVHALNRKVLADFRAQINGLVAEHRIDVLHAHGQVSAHYAREANDRRLRQVATLHSGLRTGWRWFPQVRHALRKMDIITAVSPDVARLYSVLVARRVQSIPTGVDLTQFKSAPKPRSAKPRPFTVGMVARLNSVKRHRDAIDAIRIMKDAVTHEGGDPQLVIAGDGPEQQFLIDRARDMPFVRFTGPITDTSSFYRECDAFLLCSDSEAMPVAMLEAMASGVPCVVTCVGGMREFVTRGAALGVPKRNPNAIAQALLDLQRSEALRMQLVHAASRAVDGYTVVRQAEAYHSIYRSLQ